MGKGNAGTIEINSSDLIVNGESSNGFASVVNSVVGIDAIGNSGGIEIETVNLLLQNGGRLNATTGGKGNAGVIDIEASNTITIDGITQNEIQADSGIFSIVGESGVGNANNIEIETNNLSLSNGAEISVNSLGEGQAGNLNIIANSISLENKASLSASTSFGTGGSITLQIADGLVLQENSTISARALQEANGGNLTIDAQTIVAFPSQNNDIIANAARGRGGRIDITTSAIFGLAEGNSTITNITNDLDASSEFGLDGSISINELEVNPAEGLEELPTEVIDVARLVAQNLCQQGRGSEFIVTGKGGIASSPSQTRDSSIEQVDLVEPATEEVEEVFDVEDTKETEKEIVEAQGWIISDRGTVKLVAHSTNTSNVSPQLTEKQFCP